MPHKSYMDSLIRMLLLGLVAAVVVLLLVAFLWAWVVGKRHEERGFEVKHDAGRTPVIREKENDHG